MIKKPFEIKNSEFYYYLFYGENDGLKKEIIKNKFLNNYNKENVFFYEEIEILKDEKLLYSHLLNKSFFNEDKIIIISKISEKFFNIINEVIKLENNETKIILNSGQLDTKSKLRKIFEKEKKLICTPFYKDDEKIQTQILREFFKNKKIPISQEFINLLISKSSGDRGHLRNELEKIELFTLNKKKISYSEINKIVNLHENFSSSELVDHCLAKNKKKVENILNENNFGLEDTIQILRIFLYKSFRLLNLVRLRGEEKNLDNVINSFKPPIFWKDKENVKKQLTNWNLEKTFNLIEEINNLELQVKQNSQNSLFLIKNFIYSVMKS